MHVIAKLKTKFKQLKSDINSAEIGGLARLRSKKKNKPTAALIWSVLANRLAGEMSSALFTDAVCEFLLNNIEKDPDMACKVFSIIALEKFSLTGPCKVRIMRRPIKRILQDVANLSTSGLTNPEDISGILQAKFCAEWSLRNIFRDTTEATESKKTTGSRNDQREQDSSIQGSSSSLGEELAKPINPSTANINVMLNTLDATRHWKISEDGLSIRNDGSTIESIRATKSVSQGKWYYEVTLVTAGVMLLGWASIHCQFSPDDGVGIGDDIFGFAYDGCRNLMWTDGESVSYGGTEAWKVGDVVGMYLDVDNAVVECFLNGKNLGLISPFERDHFGVQAISGYYPALSFTSFQQATVNFGATPFRHPPALPWRNLNDYGTITPEMKEAIVRPRNDSVYGRIQVDPITGLRLPILPEESNEVDYSLLCTICCDHTATITLQPPLCRSRIFQRQMFPNSESKDTESSCGLGISGLSSDESSANTSVPGLSTSSTSTSAWSTEYCGPSVPNSTNQDPNPSTPEHSRHHHSASTGAAAMTNPVNNHQYPSTDSLARRRNTVAGPSSSSSRGTLEMDCLDDPFSPPSTAYFAFLNRPSRMQRSHMHSMDMESVDPLEVPTRRPRHHHPLAESSESSIASLDRTFPPLGPLESSSGSGGIGPLDGEPSLEFSFASLGQGQNPTSLTDSTLLDADVEDNNGMDVVLVEEGREASGSEVIEQSVLDFHDGHSVHSRRNSVQVHPSLPPISETTVATIPIGFHGNSGVSNIATSPSSDFARMGMIPMSSSNMPNSSSTSTMSFGAGINVGANAAGNTGRYNGRRASMPTNRLEM
ncbi:RING finger and SPRY domain-containing protein 1 [Mortierella sp. GBA43]|nr:RING finger and SPRY domain-containing protein 1 [Mortierella sp. GBA43]